MKTLVPITLLALSGVCGAYAQSVSTVPKNIRAAYTLDNLFEISKTANADSFYGIPLEAGSVRGDAYLSPEWKRTTFLLYKVEKMVEGYAARYEISQDEFEIKTTAGIKVLDGRRVKSFVWVDSASKTPHYFINGQDLPALGGSPLTGFYEVLAEGPLTLLAKAEVVVRKPTYNVQLDMGDPDMRISKKTAFFFLEGNSLTELPSSRRKLIALFGERAGEADKFIKVNSLSLDNDIHLKALFEHLNRLPAMN